MASEPKLKVTREQLSTFIKDHNTLVQFERLIDYMNSLIPQDETDTSEQLAGAEGRISSLTSEVAELMKGQRNVITVAKAGGDFHTIKDAVDSVAGGTKTTILVAPGVYSEDNPITGKSEVTLKASGGQNTVEIEAANANQNLFNGVSGFFIEDVTLKDVTGAGKYAFELLTPGACLLDDVIIEDCSNGVHLNNSGGQIILREAAFQGTLTTCILVESGNLLESSVSVVGTATIGTIINITGVNSIATLNDVTSFSSNVTTGISIQNQARVVCNNSQLVGMYDGVVLEGGCNFRGNILTVFNAGQDALRINNVGSGTIWTCNGCTLQDSTRYDINILSATAIATGTGSASIDKFNFVQGATLIGAIIDDKEDDEGFNIVGELHVGLPEKGYESVFGTGDSYTRGMLVYTETATGNFTDVSDAARSASGSTFTFPGTAANNAIYIASSLVDAAGTLDHFGIKTKVNTAAVIGTGEIVIEYWDGLAWTEVNGMEVDSDGAYYPHAKNYFQDTGSHHIRYDSRLIGNGWARNDPMTLGTDYYWVRFRIATAITTAPILEQFKLHTNRSEMNADGWLEYFGSARPIGQLPLVIGGDRSFAGVVQNQSIWINQNVAAGLIENRFSTTTGYIGRYFFTPYDLDTSSPIELIIAGRPTGTGTVALTVGYDWVTEGDLAYTADPGLLPGKQTNTQSKSVVTGEIVIYTFNLDVSDIVSRREAGSPDFIAISINMSTATGSNIDLMALEATYTKWCEGGHV
jgi:hypothetical protein